MFLPIRDHNPSEKTPVVTITLISINVLVFLGYYFQLSDQELYRFYAQWALVPEFITEGYATHTLVTSMFLHGGILHLAGNMLFLWIFGDNLESDLGRFRYLLFYLACGVGAALAHVLADPNSLVPTVGASGAVAGVMGGYLLLYPKARVDVLFFIVVFLRVFSIPAWIWLGLWFLLQLALSGSTGPGEGGIAYWAHIGGFALGFLLIVPVWLRHGATTFWEQTQGHPDHPETSYRLTRSKIPVVRRRR